ncbi:MAG: hypothetical protein JHC33_02230 [Ignisphaera sp.]|nr:hypothetical protein [Ignisphaera sp.]
MFLIFRYIRYFFMEFLGYQGVWVRSTGDEANRFNDSTWTKSSPELLKVETNSMVKWWFYTNKEYRDNFHNSSMAFTDRERDV